MEEKVALNGGQAQAELRSVITVSVNKHGVTFDKSEANGLEIKETAIAQGVSNVNVSFDLFFIKGDEKNRIDDGDNVNLHEGDTFLMITPHAQS